MNFKGDIIITDPCYLMKSQSDWSICSYGDDLGALDFTSSFKVYSADMIANSIFNTDTNQLLGEIKSDSGMLSVLYLDEVLSYNPQFEKGLSPKCYTIIKGFNGEVSKVKIDGDPDQAYAIVGKGNINFRTDVLKLYLSYK
ncbi:MAG: hypothetical protein J6B34_04965 [Clostridia bacterium]|nr:hypothetical protein [Clostridia bacterium]